MLKGKKNSKIDILSKFFIDKIGEDITEIILKYVEYMELTRVLWCTTPRIEIKLTKKLIKYNNVSNLERKKRMIKKIRNFFFRKDIKVYSTNDILYNKILKIEYLPLGKIFEMRPIFPNLPKNVSIVNLYCYQNTYYLIIHNS